MPRSFDVSADSPASVEEIHSAYREQQYWLARLAVYGGDTITLDSLDVDNEGTVSVATTQDLRREVIPGLFARACPKDIKVLRTETWRAVGGGQVRGDVKIAACGAPASGIGTAVLAPIPAGSTLRVTGELGVGVPVIGGTIEKYLRGLVAEEITLVQLFTSNWISEHA